MDCKKFVHTLFNRCKSRISECHRKLTKEFNYVTDFCFGLDLLMALAGARLNTRNNKLKCAWRVYRVLSGLIVMLFSWNAYLSVKNHVQFEIMLSYWQALVSVTIIFIRFFLVLWHNDSVMAARRYINRRSFGRKLESSLGTRSEAFYRIRKIVTCVIVVMFFLAANIMILDISQNHLYKLPFEIKTSLSHVQLLCEKTVNALIFEIVSMKMLIFLVNYMLLAGLTAEVKVIAQAFSVIFENADRRVQTMLETEPCSSWQMEPKMKHYFWKYVKEEFNSCIRLHIEFLNMKNRILPMLNAHLYIIYYTTALSLACGAMYLAQMKSVTVFSLQILYYCFWMCYECAILLRMVSYLNEANESIGDAVYGLDWPRLECGELYKKEYTELRATMLNVIVVSQQPLRLNGFLTREFMQDRFYDLVILTYNFFNVLKDYNDCCFAKH